MTRVIRLLDINNSEFLRIQLASSDKSIIKRTLQEICRLYRLGFRLRGEDLTAMEQAIVGLLHTHRQDEKIRRWSLNAIAQLGRTQFCLQDVLDAIREFHSDPPTAAAAIAALFKLTKDAHRIIRNLDLFDNKTVALSGLQHAPKEAFSGRTLRISPDKADPDHLKLALVVVGLDKAPENLFDPQHTNKQIVKVLGSHHDAVVSQYSVWAITENDELDIDDIGIPLHTIESCPANVRAWIFKLIASSTKAAADLWEYLKLGSQDFEDEVRFQLALGLKDTFFDGLELLVLEWFNSEANAEVGNCLRDHIVRHADKCLAYEEMARTLYEKEGLGSRIRQRMLAAAAGTRIYGAFKRIDIDGSGDLFSNGAIVMNNTIIGGGAQVGAVSFGGDAAQQGELKISYNVQTVEALQSELSKALALVRAAEGLPHHNSVEASILEAQSNPGQSKIKSALENIKLFTQSASGLTDLASQLTPIALEIAKLAGIS